MSGNVLGKHKGYPFYTIGQRKGLVIAFGDPRYVIEIDPVHNKVVLGTKDDLKKSFMKVKKPNFIKYESMPQDIDILTKIRYKDKGAMSKVVVNSEGELEVVFYSEVEGIAPGQSAVFYDGNDVIGGGFITWWKETISGYY